MILYYYFLISVSKALVFSLVLSTNVFNQQIRFLAWKKTENWPGKLNLVPITKIWSWKELSKSNQCSAGLLYLHACVNVCIPSPVDSHLGHFQRDWTARKNFLKIRIITSIKRVWWKEKNDTKSFFFLNWTEAPKLKLGLEENSTFEIFWSNINFDFKV